MISVPEMAPDGEQLQPVLTWHKKRTDVFSLSVIFYFAKNLS